MIKSFKLTTLQLLRRSGERDTSFWQGRFYDHALRTRKEYDDTLSYVHMNPVQRGLAVEPRQWPWSSARWIDERVGPIEIDFLRVPSEPKETAADLKTEVHATGSPDGEPPHFISVGVVWRVCGAW